MGQVKTKPKRTKKRLKNLRGGFVEVMHNGKRIRRKEIKAFVEKSGMGLSGNRFDVFQMVRVGKTLYRLV